MFSGCLIGASIMRGSAEIAEGHIGDQTQFGVYGLVQRAALVTESTIHDNHLDGVHVLSTLRCW